MAVTITSSASRDFLAWANYTPDSSPKAVAFTLHAEGNGSLDLNTFAIDGTTSGTASIANGKVHVGKKQIADLTDDIVEAVLYILSADLPVGDLTNPAITWTGTLRSTALLTRVFSLAASTTIDVDNTSGASFTSVTDPLDGSIVCADNTTQILAAGTSTAQNSTPGSGWTEDRDVNQGGTGNTSQMFAQHKVTTTGGTINYRVDPVSADTGAIAVVSFKEAAVAPTFTVSPTVTSQTASAYTIGYTADANATNIYVGSYLKDATAPTASELKAGTGAHGTATEATTGSSDSIVLTPSESTKFPIYDVYAVLEGAGGFSSVVALVDEMLDPPSGKQFVTLVSVSSTSPLTGASPTIVAGDVWVLDTTSTAGAYTITPDTAGDFVMDVGGDATRQSFAHDVYDVSAGGYYGAGTVYVNNQAPNLIGGEGTGLLNGQIFKKSTDQGTIALSALVEDTEGDSFTFAVQSGALPTSWSLASNGHITGTPTVYGDYTYVIRITDAVGDYLDVTDSAVIGDEMPDVVDEVQATAITDIEAVANFTVTIPVSTAYSATILLGHVISQDPSAGEYVADDTTVTLTVSLGGVQGGGGLSLINNFGFAF